MTADRDSQIGFGGEKKAENSQSIYSRKMGAKKFEEYE
jgi:hypothetical protein